MPQTNKLVAFDSVGYKPDAAKVGGKGASLIRMYQAGIPVPSGFVVTTDAYYEYHSKGIPEDFRVSLLAAFDVLETERVAVRSSATNEDSDTASWAGQFESFMNVKRAKLIDNIQSCWASVSDALSYAQTQSLSEDNIAVAVVVQKMVDSDVAGVAFSVNPLNRDPNQIMVEATYGLGELLVQGMVNPDNYVVVKEDGTIIKKHISTKSTMLAYRDGVTKEVEVDENIQGIPCLNEEQLSELTQMVQRIEQYYDSPQDIEFAYNQGRLSIVQSRPITTV